jgi:hypothetical protein
LGTGDDDPILLTDGLEFVADESLEVFVIEDLPELVDPQGERGTVDEGFGAVEQVGGNRCTEVRMVQKLGDIKRR